MGYPRGRDPGHAQAQGPRGEPGPHPPRGARGVRRARVQGREHGRDRGPDPHHARTHQLLLRRQGEGLPGRAGAGLRGHPPGGGPSRSGSPFPGGRDPSHRGVHLHLLPRARGLRAAGRGGEPGAGPAPEEVARHARAQPAHHRHDQARPRARPARGPLPEGRGRRRGPQGDRRARHVQRHQPVHVLGHLPAGDGRPGRRRPPVCHRRRDRPAVPRRHERSLPCA